MDNETRETLRKEAFDKSLLVVRQKIASEYGVKVEAITDEAAIQYAIAYYELTVTSQTNTMSIVVGDEE